MLQGQAGTSIMASLFLFIALFPQHSCSGDSYEDNVCRFTAEDEEMIVWSVVRCAAKECAPRRLAISNMYLDASASTVQFAMSESVWKGQGLPMHVRDSALSRVLPATPLKESRVRHCCRVRIVDHSSLFDSTDVDFDESNPMRRGWPMRGTFLDDVLIVGRPIRLSQSRCFVMVSGTLFHQNDPAFLMRRCGSGWTLERILLISVH
jgi:hypothetical protein